MAAVVAVGLAAWLIYAWLFKPSTDLAPMAPELTASETKLFASCKRAIQRIDSQARIGDRPDVDKGPGLSVGWPYGGDDLVVHGQRTSGSCVVDAAGNVSVLTIGGKDVI